MSLRAAAEAARAWPFEEARKILARLGGRAPAKGHVLFETGYGPSGLPHIGTFGEVVRTSMVRQAFTLLSDIPTRLVCFSDDMDGLRKVPGNVPNPDLLRPALGLPLTRVPDPFGTHPSFGQHNNARLCAFLDGFGFDYEFRSATEAYGSGAFDSALIRVAERHEQIMALMLPTLGAERQATYSPFLPLSPSTGRVLQVPIRAIDPGRGTLAFTDEDGTEVEQSFLGGRAKLQWKPDWGMRWFAQDVDYEMAGKDLIDSVRLAAQITQILGGTPPAGFNYELFLDEKGQKISKSKGNGLSIEEWLRYAPAESLSLFMYQKPRTAKRLYFDVIPRAVEEYAGFVEAALRPETTPEHLLENPAWHIHAGQVPDLSLPVGFGMLLNLAGVVNAEEPSVLWGFIRRYAPDATPETMPFLAKLVDHAIRYYQDHVRPTKTYRLATAEEAAALRDLDQRLAGLPAEAGAERIMEEVYAVGKSHGFAQLRDWFRTCYEVLLGSTEGPRMGSFIQLYGIAETRALIASALSGALAGSPAG